MVAVLQIVPAGVFSAAYDVLVDGLPRGRIEHRMLSLRDEAVIVADDRTFKANRPRVFRAAAVLESPEGTLRAKAEKESFWRENYRVQFDGATLLLHQKRMSWHGVFTIAGASGVIGGIRQEKLFTRGMLVEFTTESPPPLEISEFLVWIVLVVRRRQSSN